MKINWLHILFAFIAGFMLQGMMKNMCGGRLVEGIVYPGTDHKPYIDGTDPDCLNFTQEAFTKAGCDTFAPNFKKFDTDGYDWDQFLMNTNPPSTANHHKYQLCRCKKEKKHEAESKTI